MYRTQNQLIETPLGSIEYAIVGSGVPIVFVHGGHSNCLETLSHKGFESEGYQLITPSRPGYGKTPLGERQTPRQAADLIAALLERLAIGKVIVYGISAGGLTALELAANHPDKVQKMILASAVSKKWLTKQARTYQIAKVMFQPGVEKLVWGMVRLFGALMPALIARSFYPQFSTLNRPKLKREDIHELIASMKHYNSGSGFINDIEQDIDEGVLGKIDCPTLIVHSKYDASVGLAHAQHAKAKISHATLELLDNEWGHLFWIGAGAKAVIDKTKRFIEA